MELAGLEALTWASLAQLDKVLGCLGSHISLLREAGGKFISK